MKRVLVIVVTLLAAGCGTGSDPAATATTTETTTTTAEPTTSTSTPTSTSPSTSTTSSTQPTTTTTSSAPTTSTTASAGTTPAPADEVLSPAGFWEVRVGETIAENESRIGGAFDELGGDPTSCLVLQLPEVGGTYFIASTLTDEPVDSRQNLVVGRVSTEAPGWVSANGVEVGMPVAEAEAALGDSITDRQPHFYVDGGEYLVVGPEDSRYIFETDGEAITAIHAGMEPIVSYVEACS